PSPRVIQAASAPEAWPEIAWSGKDGERFVEQLPERLAPVLAAALRSRSWFWGKSRSMLRAGGAGLRPATDPPARAVVQADYAEGEPDRYLLPAAVAWGRAAEKVAARHPESVMARLRGAEGEDPGVLYDAVWDRAFCEGLLAVMGRRAGLKGTGGE